jgi:hypothetical protein
MYTKIHRWFKMHTLIYVNVWENIIVVVGLKEGARGRWERKRGWKRVNNLKFITSKYGNSIIKYTESCWITEEHDDGERVSNRGLIWLNYNTYVCENISETPLNNNIHLKKWRTIKQNRFCLRLGTSGREEGRQRRWRRANMVDVLCIWEWR